MFITAINFHVYHIKHNYFHVIIKQKIHEFNKINQQISCNVIYPYKSQQKLTAKLKYWEII